MLADLDLHLFLTRVSGFRRTVDSSTMLNKPIKNNNIATNKDALMSVGSCEKYQGPLLEEIGHWLDMVYLPPQGEFCRPYFS